MTGEGGMSSPPPMLPDDDWWLQNVTMDDVRNGLRLIMTIDVELGGDPRGELGNEISWPRDLGRIRCTADAQLAVRAAIERRSEPAFAAVADVLVEARDLPLVRQVYPRQRFPHIREFLESGGDQDGHVSRRG